MLVFPYQALAFRGLPPPTLPPTAKSRWRPLVPVRIIGPTGKSHSFSSALLDPGSDDTIFPSTVIPAIDAIVRFDPGHRIRWRGQIHSMQFSDVELELTDQSGITCRWPAVISFSPAPIGYPLLGNAGCLEFFDANFRGAGKIVELKTNAIYPGTET